MGPKNKVTFNLSSISTSSRNFVATEARASSGQLWNQSIVQQLTSDGNLRRRVRNASPIGDIARTMCSWSLTRSINMLEKFFELAFFGRFISNFYYFYSHDGGLPYYASPFVIFFCILDLEWPRISLIRNFFKKWHFSNVWKIGNRRSRPKHDLTIYDLRRNNPPAWELTCIFSELIVNLNLFSLKIKQNGARKLFLKAFETQISMQIERSKFQAWPCKSKSQIGLAKRLGVNDVH